MEIQLNTQLFFQIGCVCLSIRLFLLISFLFFKSHAAYLCAMYIWDDLSTTLHFTPYTLHRTVWLGKKKKSSMVLVSARITLKPTRHFLFKKKNRARHLKLRAPFLFFEFFFDFFLWKTTSLCFFIYMYMYIFFSVKDNNFMFYLHVHVYKWIVFKILNSILW